LSRDAVLIVSFFFRPNVGGIETHLNDLIKLLESIGLKTFVVTFQPLTSAVKGETVERFNSIRIYRIPNPLFDSFYRLDRHSVLRFLILSTLLFIGASAVLAKQRNQIGVIHANNYTTALLTVVLSRIFSTRSVITIYDTHDFFNEKSPGFLRRFAGRLLSSFDSIIAISEKGKNEILSLNIDAGKIAVMTFWIDLNIFTPCRDPSEKYSPNADRKFSILFVGRLIEAKGVTLLLQAAERLKSDPRIVFKFVGQGPLRQKIIETSKYCNNVSYLGAFGPERLRECYCDADVTIVPSIHEEGYGRVIMEAIACATPVIASRRGAIAEVMDESVGILVEPDIEEILQLIKMLSNDILLLRRLAANCRPYAVRKFSMANSEVILRSYNGKFG
jgi:glycosyltransferase involved in cell wall biosynthesis